MVPEEEGEGGSKDGGDAEAGKLRDSLIPDFFCLGLGSSTVVCESSHRRGGIRQYQCSRLQLHRLEDLYGDDCEEKYSYK